MYKMSVFLKLIILLLLTIVVIVTNNYFVLWLLLVLLTFINFKLKHRLEFIIDLILIILLILVIVYSKFLVLYKLLLIINLILTTIRVLEDREKSFLKSTFTHKNNKYYRTKFYEDSFNKIYDDNKKKVIEEYNNASLVDDTIEDSLERKYLQARMRFYGYKENNEEFLEWTKLDTMILMLFLLIFMILLILR